jgi:hypothetical protein
VLVDVGGKGVSVDGTSGGCGVSVGSNVGDGVLVGIAVAVADGCIATGVAVGRLLAEVGLDVPATMAVGSSGKSSIAKKIAAITVKVTTISVPIPMAIFCTGDEPEPSFGKGSGEDTFLPHP